MSNLSQEQINADLFNEVQRLKRKSRVDEEEIRRLKEENRKLRLKIEDCTCFKYVEDEEGV
ncbi:hypothetical protein GXP75_18840 [Bacillus sp. HU-1818]|uniref:hypothetical protein n=1 Tax=Bacillus sp. HU-1818 TaxID=2704469 RepID=UPI001F5C0B14|nr:hypothetical protein [Bacillus sp. HU-1818]MCI3197686.1 hypothetical protein [Bacillus sp. HU-1818]